MNSQLIVSFVEAAFGRILDGAVHPLGLTVRPGMLGLGQPMIDIVEGAVRRRRTLTSGRSRG
jgi:hypothetical protein